MKSGKFSKAHALWMIENDWNVSNDPSIDLISTKISIDYDTLVLLIISIVFQVILLSGFWLGPYSDNLKLYLLIVST